MQSALLALLNPLSGFFLYPFALGLVATINPCGFPLLPVYLSLFVEGDATDNARLLRRIARAMSAGACATVGFVALFGTLGLFSEEGLSGLYGFTASWARYVMVGLGALLCAVGIAGLAGKHLRARLPELRPGIGLRRPLALFVFGLSYGIASLGCSLPLFLAGVSGAFLRSGTVHGTETFLAYAIGMGLLFTFLGIVIAIAGAPAARRLRAVSRLVAPLGSLALVVVGAYLLLYWIEAIADPTKTAAPVAFVERIQQDIATWLSAHASTIGVVLVVVALLLIALISWARSQRERVTLK